MGIGDWGLGQIPNPQKINKTNFYFKLLCNIFFDLLIIKIFNLTKINE